MLRVVVGALVGMTASRAKPKRRDQEKAESEAMHSIVHNQIFYRPDCLKQEIGEFSCQMNVYVAKFHT